MTVPCGKCVKCISKKRKEWAFRLNEESKDHATAYFITLTYDENHLPYLNQTTGEYPVRLKDDITKYQETDYMEKIVYKKDVQDFIKQLRSHQNHFVKKHAYRNHPNRKHLVKDKKILEKYKIRYYFTSEYGTQFTKRPHYHGIVWNLEPQVNRKLELQKIWKHGQVNTKPIKGGDYKAYYYLTKYLYKQKNYDIWTFKPFQLMSTKPYIGNRYLETSKHYHIGKGDLLTKFNKHNMILPRIYKDKLPNYLKKATKQKLLQIDKEKEEILITLAKKQTHHWEILEYFKQETREDKEKLEALLFKSKFIKS
jgi:hypothetical protein